MRFRENLKEELAFSGMLVKELAAKTGLNKRTLDKYLRSNGSIPSAEAAVRIARVLGVSVEYLVTGQDSRTAPAIVLRPAVRSLVKAAENLDEEHYKLILGLAENLKELQERRRLS
jgi:transcriptional regulator with XRE-family HTH domain